MIMFHDYESVCPWQDGQSWRYQQHEYGKNVTHDEPVDYTILHELLEILSGDEPDTAGDFITIFLQDAPNYLMTMRQALYDHDAQALLHAAHTLKSSSAQFGALPLSRYCKKIEAMGLRSGDQEIRELVLLAEAEYIRVRKVLKEMLQVVLATPGSTASQ
jgi:HPt (histidine-containing phosphotransfer) domain-containing protein